MTNLIASGLDLAKLQKWFDQNIEGARGPLSAELLVGGRSNLTFKISDGTTEWVLRRPPLGLVAPSANDVAREFRVLAGLRNTDVRVPTALGLCTDPLVIGAPFAVVSMVHGQVIMTTSQVETLDAPTAQRCARSLTEQLASIHAVPVEDVGLGDLGKPTGYVGRQIRRWMRQWGIVTDRHLSDFDHLHRRLADQLPADDRGVLIHGDFRIDNTILTADDPGQIEAVIDWEMATLGHPIADLGLYLVYMNPACSPLRKPTLIADRVAAGSFPSALELADLYASKTGEDLSALPFFLGLAYFKLAVIAEGINRRIDSGQAPHLQDGPTAEELCAAGLAELG